jgi:hypothetical protein
MLCQKSGKWWKLQHGAVTWNFVKDSKNRQQKMHRIRQVCRTDYVTKDSRATMNNWKIRNAVPSNIEGGRQREAETGDRRLWSPSNRRQRPQESRNFEGNGYSNLSAALMMQRCRNFMILLFLNTWHLPEFQRPSLYGVRRVLCITTLSRLLLMTKQSQTQEFICGQHNGST